MAQSFNYQNAPEWIKDGRMTKRLYGDFALLKNTNLYLEKYSEASTMLDNISFIYESIKSKITDKISTAENAKKSTKNLQKKLNTINSDCAFLQRLYSYYKDIIFAGFDFNDEFSCFLDLVASALKKNVPLNKMKLYSYVTTLSEYVTSAHTVIFYATEIEIAHTILTLEINNSPLSDFDKAHTLDVEDCSYYWKMRILKNMWGSMANALDRTLDFGKPLDVLNINNNYEILPSAEELSTLQQPLDNRSYYKWLVKNIVEMRTKIRTKENIYFAEDRQKAELETDQEIKTRL